MNGLPYYKAYPRDFVEGTIGMDFELKGAYRLVLDLIYMQGGQLPDDARYISGLLGCTLKKWNGLRQRLIDLGKIEVRGEFLANNRADKELEALGKFSEKQRKNRTHPNKIKEIQSPRFDHSEPEPYIREEAKASPLPVTDDSAAAVAIYNEAASRAGWSQVQKMTKPRFSALRARLKEAGGLEGWRHAIERAEASDFLCGRRPTRDGSAFFASFDFLTQAKSFTRLMEGTYDDRTSQPRLSNAAPQGHQNRPDPALANIARIVGLGSASGDGRG